MTRTDQPLGRTNELKASVVEKVVADELAVIAFIRTSSYKKYADPLYKKILTMFAVLVSAAVIVISSIREPLVPAVTRVPTLVGEVRDVSADDIETAHALTFEAKFGVVAIIVSYL